MANEFRMSLLKDRADKVRPDLHKARKIIEKAEATETDDGMAIRGRFDLDTEFGKSAYRNTRGRRVSGPSIGYAIRNSTKELGDRWISVVSRASTARHRSGAAG